MGNVLRWGKRYWLGWLIELLPWVGWRWFGNVSVVIVTWIVVFGDGEGDGKAAIGGASGFADGVIAEGFIIVG